EPSSTRAIPSTKSRSIGPAVSTPPRGYIFTKPVATQTPGISDPTHLPGPRIVLQHKFSQPVMVSIIFAVIAGIVGIIVGSAGLILLLRRRNRERTSTPKTSEQPEEIEDLPQ
uniref:Glycophorin-A n=1 Tax=Bos indicus x Bos taurus TaxID=30522 RepID=A0A4W2DTS2_BOBOX